MTNDTNIFEGQKYWSDLSTEDTKIQNSQQWSQTITVYLSIFTLRE